MSNPSKFDFTAWLETKNPNEKYNFSDMHGCCAMGQYMAARGESWSMPRYGEYVAEVLASQSAILSNYPQTFGGALERVRMLEDA